MGLNETGEVDLGKIAELLRIVARHCDEGNAEMIRVLEELQEANARLDRMHELVGDVELDARSVVNFIEEMNNV